MRNQEDWIDPRIIRLSKRRHRLLKKRRSRPGDPVLEGKNSEVNGRIKELKEQTKNREFEVKFGSDVPANGRWQNLNQALESGTKQTQVDLLHVEGSGLVRDGSEIADNFCKFFSEVSGAIDFDAERALGWNRLEEACRSGGSKQSIRTCVPVVRRSPLHFPMT